MSFLIASLSSAETGKVTIVHSINGTKKWITNGTFADYFVTGCKTEKGFSVILVPRSEGVETKKIKTSYSTAAATAFIEFNNVKVPVNHLLGKEDNGVRLSHPSQSFHPLSSPQQTSLLPNQANERKTVHRNHVQLQPRTLGHVLQRHPLDAHHPRRMPQMDLPTPRLLQTPHLPTRHPPKTRKNDLPS